MNIKNTMLVFMLISMGATELAMAEDQPSRARIKEANSALKTFKNDMKCLFSRTKKCTPEQKRRIVSEGVALAGLVAAGVGMSSFAWRRMSKRRPIGEDVVLKAPGEAVGSDGLGGSMLLKKLRWPKIKTFKNESGEKITVTMRENGFANARDEKGAARLYLRPTLGVYDEIEVRHDMTFKELKDIVGEMGKKVSSFSFVDSTSGMESVTIEDDNYFLQTDRVIDMIPIQD